MKKYYHNNSSKTKKRYKEDGIHLRKIKPQKDRKFKLNARNYELFFDD